MEKAFASSELFEGHFWEDAYTMDVFTHRFHLGMPAKMNIMKKLNYIKFLPVRI
jgi:hypothetical protein